MRYKFTPPTLPPLYLRRPAHLQALNQGRVFKSQVIQGVAASGKSTLLIDWIQHSGLQYCWLSLDLTEQDPVEFCLHLLAAIQFRWPELHLASSEMASTLKPQGIRAFLSTLADDLTRQIEIATVFVFDDAHYLADNPDILAYLNDFTRFLPDQFHILYSSHPRQNPEWLMQSAQGDLWLHSPEFLKFTDAELKQYLDLRQLHLNTEQIELLQSKTQGWAGGLTLLTQMMQTQTDPGEWLRQRSSDELIFAFYVRLLTKRDSEFEAFLLKISYLPVLEQAICLQLFPDLPVQSYLERIFQLNLFVNLIPGSGMRFSPALRHYLQQSFLRQHHLEQQQQFWALLAIQLAPQMPEQAFDYFIQAKCFEQAQSLLLRLQGHYFDQQQYSKLQSMLSKLEAVSVLNLELELIFAELLRLQGQLEQAQIRLDRLSESYPEQAEMMIYQAAIACQKGEIQTALQKANIKLPLQSSLQTRAFQANLLGVCQLMQHQPQDALEAFQQAFKYYQDLNWPSHQAKIMHNEGLAYTWLGQLKQAKQAYTRSLEVLHQHHIIAPPMTRHNLAIIHLYLGEYEIAQSLLIEAQAQAHKLGMITEQVFTLATLGRLYSRIHQAEQAHHYLERCQQWVEKHRHPSLRQFTQLIQLEHALRQDDIEQARLILQGHFESSQASELENLEWRIRQAEFWIKSNQLADAHQSLVQLKNTLEKVNYRFHLARVLFLLAQLRPGHQKAQAETWQQAAEKLCHEYHYSELQKEFKIQATPARTTTLLTETPCQVQLFGKMMVWQHDKLIGTDVWGGKKVRLLLALLLLKDQGLEWQEIAEYLSPEEDMKRPSVNAAITRLRRAIENPHKPDAQIVIFTEGRYRLNPAWHVQVDLQHFYYCYQQSQTAPTQQKQNYLEQTIKTYQQSLLKEFEDLVWVQWEQEHARKCFRQACLNLFELLKGQTDVLLNWSDQAIRQDKVFEEAHLTKLELMSQMGNRRGVMQHLKQMEHIYRKELDLPLPEEAIAIRNKIKS